MSASVTSSKYLKRSVSPNKIIICFSDDFELTLRANKYIYKYVVCSHDVTTNDVVLEEQQKKYKAQV